MLHGQNDQIVSRTVQFGMYSPIRISQICQGKLDVSENAVFEC